MYNHQFLSTQVDTASLEKTLLTEIASADHSKNGTWRRFQEAISEWLQLNPTATPADGGFRITDAASLRLDSNPGFLNVAGRHGLLHLEISEFAFEAFHESDERLNLDCVGIPA